MKYLTSEEIRNTWLNFFKERGHMIEPGASLIPLDDPTLLWINSGVAALKKYFDGSKIPESKRITNVQKCIRTNDIENVGKTARHHTFFEMLGNFSIGDYFRKEVIPWAYEILTSNKYFALPKEKLYITYHPTDKETFALWVKEGMDESHLIPLEDNFWQIGEGPCGPNTEVFFDRGVKYDKENIGIDLLKNDIENDRYIEIWGIVFSQFNAINGVKREDYKELPHKNIDTGAGLERIACVLQETETNFETDLFMPIIKEIQKLSTKPYENEYLMPYRVIADHIRACVFALSDGEMFSNEGRGYVLRRLLRRAMKYAQKLDLYEPFMYKLVDVVINNMKCFYPYLVGKEDYLKRVILNEEEKFIKTLNKGENILKSLIKEKGSISGEDAFKLYDTYGFPFELTKEIALDNNIEIDEDEFDSYLTKQKELARQNRKSIDSFALQHEDLLNFKEESSFFYDTFSIKNTMVNGLFVDGHKVDVINEEGDVCLSKTCFYSEMGGQVSDSGTIFNKDFKANVVDVFLAPNGEHLHHIKVLYGEVKIGDVVNAELNKNRRENIMKNHSATHLLQSALIAVLGNQIHQKGSFVNDKYLRFDFSYEGKVSEENLTKVENLVNQYISMGIEQNTKILSLDDAKKEGAISEFNEKYKDVVRVVCFDEISKEFCGGTHVKNSRDIGIFIIKSESSISSGVRRIEATTGIEAYRLIKEKDLLLGNIRSLIGVKSNNEIEVKLNVNSEYTKELKNLNTSLNMKLASLLADSILNLSKNKEGINYVIKYFDNTNLDSLVMISDCLKKKVKSTCIILVGKDKDKYPLLVSLTDDLVKEGYLSKNIIKKVNACLGGNGGGKPEISKGNVLSILNLDNLIDNI